MSREYRIEQSCGKWYVFQFDVCKRQTAHAKLDNIRQLALWIEEQENYDKVTEQEETKNAGNSDTDIDGDIIRSTFGYYYNSGYKEE